MEEDDAYPTEGSYFVPREPADQVIERKKEKAKTLEAINVIHKVLGHLDRRIAFRDSIEALKVNLKESPELHQKKCEVNELLKLALQEEKQLLEELLDIHTRKT